MGMTIDEAIEELEWALANNTIEDVESAFKYISAIHMATETMRKYQKIEQIVNSNPDCIHHTDMDTYKLNSIREVLEDGSN